MAAERQRLWPYRPPCTLQAPAKAAPVCVGMRDVRWVCCTAVTVRGRLVLARLCALQNVPPLGPRKVIVPDWCEYVVL